ncbi:MAG: glycosyltransferase [Bacteroidia bacterium]
MKLQVSVCMITYNHESYIAQAIEGVINQKMNFNYKLFIGEDCSNDNTRSICISYKNKYPDKIELIFTTKNDVYQNVKNIFDACFNSGAKYIAICEGDDYWTDPNKLQKQVDFLEAHTDYAFCYHHVQTIHEANFNNKKLEMKRDQPETSTIAELLRLNIWAHINSVVFRNQPILKNLPTWYSNSPSSDWALLALVTGDKKIKYFSETMSVYRQHATGMWSSQTEIQNIKRILNTARLLNTHLVKKKDKKHIYWTILCAYEELIKLYKPLNRTKAYYYAFLFKILNYYYAFIVRKDAAQGLSRKELMLKIKKGMKRRFMPKKIL